MFQHVNMRIQNISRPHTAFADVKTNVYNPKMFFPVVKMRVQNVYYRHKAFQVCDTKHLLTSHTLYGYQKACPDRQIAFPHVNMRIQNVSQTHTAFPDVVYNPIKAFSGFKMRV